MKGSSASIGIIAFLLLCLYLLATNQVELPPTPGSSAAQSQQIEVLPTLVAVATQVPQGTDLIAIDQHPAANSQDEIEASSSDIAQNTAATGAETGTNTGVVVSSSENNTYNITVAEGSSNEVLAAVGLPTTTAPTTVPTATPMPTPTPEALITLNARVAVQVRVKTLAHPFEGELQTIYLSEVVVKLFGNQLPLATALSNTEGWVSFPGIAPSKGPFTAQACGHYEGTVYSEYHAFPQLSPESSFPVWLLTEGQMYCNSITLPA